VGVATHIGGTVSRLDPSTGSQEAVIEVGDGPIAFGATADALEPFGPSPWFGGTRWHAALGLTKDLRG